MTLPQLGEPEPALPAEAPRPAPPRDKMHWCFYGAAVILAAMGLINLNDFRYALAAQKRWAAAGARVIGNTIEVHRGRKGSRSYNTFVDYEYSVGNSVYIARAEIFKYRLFMSESGAEADLRKAFPVGKSIYVYYDPGDSGRSSLGLAGAPGIGVVLAFFALAYGAFYFGREQF